MKTRVVNGRGTIRPSGADSHVGAGQAFDRGLFFTRLTCLFVMLGAATTGRGQVVINEVVAANSDRLLCRDAPGYPKLGITTPWYLPEYDDALWNSGKGPFGFGTFSGVTLGVNTSATMQNKLVSLYVRKTFTVTSGQAASSEQLQLLTRYNDGFIAFVNGVEVARRNMGNPGMFAYRDQTAFNTNWANASQETISLGVASNVLVSGANVLCIQTHNQAVASANFLSMADLRIGGMSPVTLVANTSSWKYFAGVSEPSGGVIDYGLINGVPLTATWATLGFNDSSWPEANGPFGFERAVPPDYILGTNLSSQMYGIAASVYTRTLFSATVGEATSSEPLQLVIDYDDGIIVYLNGREVARRNVGTVNTITPHDTLATAGHSANGDGGATGREEVLSLGAANMLLSGGDNVLAVQIHNSALTSSDLIGRVTLSTTGVEARTLAGPSDLGRFFVGTSEPQSEETEEDADMDEDTPDSENDWVELYNAGVQAVNLTGWSLTDDEGKPRKWYFPAGSTVPAGGYLLVMATGYEVGPADGATYVHTNFKLSSDGEYLGLVDASGMIVSELAPAFPAQSHFHAYVRKVDGTYAFSDTATPGAANAGNLFTAITAPPDFSHLGGFYASGFLLQMAAPDPEAVVRYTLDGSEPTATNALYTAPFSVSGCTTVRARCFKDGEIPSAVRTHNYLVGESAARKSLPVLCLSGSASLALYGPNASDGSPIGEGVTAIKGGGYIAKGTNPADVQWDYLGDLTAFNIPMQKGRSSERAVGLEYYPTSGIPLRTEVGLRLSGSPHARPRYKITTASTEPFSPTDYRLKPSFNFFFRNELGESPQDYAFFPGGRVTKFENMRLRAGKNDVSNPFIKDELMRRIYIGTGQEGSLGSIVSLYLNGVWKGYYNFCEHLRESFMQQHHNSAVSWDVVQVGDFANGDSIHWNNTFAFLRTNDFSSVANYARVQEFVDTDNVIDYLMVNAYAAMWDWPNNNWIAARERSDAGRWRFYMWDAEGCFGADNRNPATYDSFIGDRDGDGVGGDSNTVRLDIGAAATASGTAKDIRVVYTRLLTSPEFRLRFADRAQKHLFHGGCLTRESMEALYFSLRDAINPIMQETIHTTLNQTFYNAWIATDVRRTAFFSQLVKYGFWPSTLAPEFSQHGGTLAPNTQVAINNPNGAGSVYFTTNGVDPRALGGAIAGSLYTGPVSFALSAVLKARVLSSGGVWSPLQEASFIVPVDVPVFMPTGSADWTTDASWTSSPMPYPNGTNVAVLVNAPVTADRDINLRAPVTVGSITVFQNDCAFRNKIRDRSSGNTLTFMATNGPAVLAVNGAGNGYVEFEVEADTILASDLRVEVNNTVGNAGYGALRLRANWRGAGGVIKEGDGVASFTGDSKSYTGVTRVNQGVLQLTEPACPFQSVSVSVADGGQLRLTSASTDGAPRIYTFGGPLTLDSLGRGGVLPSSGQGVLGGLRYEPESDDSIAIVTVPVVFEGLTDIHAEGSRNTLELSGALTGTKGFIKSGGGKLVLSAQSKRYLAPVVVSNGTLSVEGRILSAVELAPGGVLSGCGRVGPLFGMGTVAVDGTVLTAPSALGLNYGFSFVKTGSPTYATAGSCGNGVLRLLTIDAAETPSVIDVYLDTTAFTEGDVLRGGFFVEGGLGLAGFLNTATVRFFEPNLSGTQKFAGRTYAPYSGDLALTVTAMPEAADFGDGPRSGEVMEIRVAGAPVSYAEWVLSYYPASAGENESVSGPLADPYQEGVANLLRYALDIKPGDVLSDRLPLLKLDDKQAVYQFSFDPGKRDIVYRVEASSNLYDWSRVLFDSRYEKPASWDGETLILSDDAVDPSVVPRQFYRLRVLLADP